MQAPTCESGTRVAVAGCGYWGKNLVRNLVAFGVLGAAVEGPLARHEYVQSVLVGFDCSE